MSLRNRYGKWHYRFKVAGKVWTASTDLAATERNRSSALLQEAQAQRLIRDGKGDQLRLEIRTFSDAADQFIEWAKGEYHGRPNTWKRLRGSMTAGKDFFKAKPLHTVNGDLLDFMAWRRGLEVKEVTVRHDLHALSLLFKYGMAHNWCRSNPATSGNLKHMGTKMPTDADAIRIHVLTPAEETRYFQGCLRPPESITVRSKPHTQVRNGKRISIASYEYTKLSARDYQDLHDIGRLMILQGPRPSEVMQARVEDVNLELGTWRIPRSKSKAGERTLRLTAEARSILACRIAASLSGWLFGGKLSGTHLQTVDTAHTAVLNATGLSFVLYDCRHTFATRFYQATRDLEALRKVLGHANLRSILKYVHVSGEHVDGAMRAYEATLTQQPTLPQPERGKTVLQ